MLLILPGPLCDDAAWVISAGIIAIHPVGENSQCAYDAAATPYLPWQLYIYVLYIYVCIICIIYIYMYYIYIYTTNQLSSYIYIYVLYEEPSYDRTKEKKRPEREACPYTTLLPAS